MSASRDELHRRMREISLLLMHLANASNGNAREFDAILAADVALREALAARP